MTKRDAVNLPHDRKFLRLDFARLQKMAEVIGMIAAEFSGGDPVVRHCDLSLAVASMATNSELPTRLLPQAMFYSWKRLKANHQAKTPIFRRQEV